MENKNYHTTIEVEQSPLEVFNAVTAVPNWWSKDFEGSSSKQGDVFIIHHPGQHYSKQEVVEAIPGKKLVWLVRESKLYWLQKDQEEWTNTKMVFEINVGRDKTLVHFTHEGLVPEMECYSMCEMGWNIVIKNWLAHLIVAGTPSGEMLKAAEVREKALRENG